MMVAMLMQFLDQFVERPVAALQADQRKGLAAVVLTIAGPISARLGVLYGPLGLSKYPHRASR